MSLGVVKVGYKKDIGKVSVHLKYIGFRSRDQQGEERGFFDNQRDRGADYEKFLDSVAEHKALQHTLTPKIHTAILSMREEDYKQLVENGISFKEMTRDLMQQLEERKGLQLNWIAAQHDKAGHPHVHVAIRSVGEDATGQDRRLKLDKDDIAWLRERMNTYIRDHAQIIEHERTTKNTQAKKIDFAPKKRASARTPMLDFGAAQMRNAQPRKQKRSSSRRQRRRQRSRMQQAQQTQQQAQRGPSQ